MLILDPILKEMIKLKEATRYFLLKKLALINRANDTLHLSFKSIIVLDDMTVWFDDGFL